MPARVLASSHAKVVRMFFVHHTAIQAEGYRSLNEGQAVEFEVRKGPKGLQAENVVSL